MSGPVSPTERNQASVELCTKKKNVQTVRALLWVPFTQERKKMPSAQIKKYQELVSSISHSQPMCFVFLSSTWHFKIRVISPAGAPTVHTKQDLDQTNVKCTKGRCYFLFLYEPIPTCKESDFIVKAAENKTNFHVALSILIYKGGVVVCVWNHNINLPFERQRKTTQLICLY